MIRPLLYLLLIVLSCGSARAGINDGLIEWLNKQANFSGVRQVTLHPVINDTGMQFEFDAAAAATRTFQEYLGQAGLTLVDPKTNESSQLIIKNHVVYFKPGSAGERWVGFGGGSSVCILRAQLFDGETGNLVGDLAGVYQVQTGGLFSIGAERRVPGAAAELISERLLELVGLTKPESSDDENE